MKNLFKHLIFLSLLICGSVYSNIQSFIFCETDPDTTLEIWSHGHGMDIKNNCELVNLDLYCSYRIEDPSWHQCSLEIRPPVGQQAERAGYITVQGDTVFIQRMSLDYNIIRKGTYIYVKQTTTR